MVGLSLSITEMIGVTTTAALESNRGRHERGPALHEGIDGTRPKFKNRLGAGSVSEWGAYSSLSGFGIRAGGDPQGGVTWGAATASKASPVSFKTVMPEPARSRL